jgi:hypothetical protein
MRSTSCLGPDTKASVRYLRLFACLWLAALTSESSFAQEPALAAHASRTGSAVVLIDASLPSRPVEWNTELAFDSVLHHISGTDTLRFRIRFDSLAGGGYVAITEALLPGASRRLSRWIVKHPVFRVRLGDVNGDGVKDLCLGLVKTTRHDPVARKRLFVYSLRHGFIRPLWLGSFLGTPWSDFRLINDQGRMLVETCADRKGAARPPSMRWVWKSFGFTHASESGGDRAACSDNPILKDAGRIQTIQRPAQPKNSTRTVRSAPFSGDTP